MKKVHCDLCDEIILTGLDHIETKNCIVKVEVFFLKNGCPYRPDLCDDCLCREVGNAFKSRLKKNQ